MESHVRTALSPGEVGRAIAPTSLVQGLGKIGRFKRGAQEDAHELLRMLLGAMSIQGSGAQEQGGKRSGNKGGSPVDNSRKDASDGDESRQKSRRLSFVEATFGMHPEEVVV